MSNQGLGNCGESYLARNAIAFVQHGSKVIGIPMTAEGMNLELLEKNLYTYRPKLILLSALYIIHRNYYFPVIVGSCCNWLNANCVILEDNAYEGLNFEPVPAPIKALDRKDIVTLAPSQNHNARYPSRLLGGDRAASSTFGRTQAA